MDFESLMLGDRLHNEDTPEKRRQAAAAAARRGRAANAGNAPDAQTRTGTRLLRRPSGEACPSRSTSFKRATDTAASATSPPVPGSSTAGYAASAAAPDDSVDAAGPGGAKPAKSAALAAAKGKGSNAAR